MRDYNELVQVLAVLYLLSEYKRLGRYQISEILSLGEGVVRRILKRLRDKGFVTTSRGGTSLTLRGKELLKAIFRKFDIKKVAEVNVTKIIGSGYSGIGVCCSTLSQNVLKIRDEVVRGGAEGALILKFERGKLTIPYLDKEEIPGMHEFVESVTKTFELSDGDVVIVGFNKKLGRALMGAIRATLAFHKE